MKKLVIAGLILGFLTVIGLTSLASAQTFRTGGNTTVGADEVIDGSLWISGSNVDIAGEVNGDVYCAGSTVTISGAVRGDVLCAAQTIRLSGTVDGDVRLAAQSATVGGQIAANLSAAAQTFTLEGSGNIGGDASVASNDAVFNGSVGRDVAAAGRSVVISGSVGRNVKASLEDVRVNERATIGGELTYTSERDADIANGAEIAGGSFRYQPDRDKRDNGVFGFGFRAYMILSMLLLALALVLLFPRAFQATSQQAISSPGKTLLIGLAAVFLLPALIISLMITIIGIPLAILLMLGWFVILILSLPLVGYYTGRLIWRNQRNPIAIMMVGLLIVLILLSLPIIKAFAFLAVLLLGTGMAVRELMGRTPRPTYDTTAKG